MRVAILSQGCDVAIIDKRFASVDDIVKAAPHKSYCRCEVKDVDAKARPDWSYGWWSVDEDGKPKCVAQDWDSSD